MMGYPPQGIDDDVLRKSKISSETWEMLLAANSPARLCQLIRRLLHGETEQGEQ